jgi:hypothetical protein
MMVVFLLSVTDFVVLPFGRIFDESDQLAIIALNLQTKTK